MENSYLIAGTRTPFAKAGGPYAGETALSLSAALIREAAITARPDILIWGQVIPAATYSNLAREAAIDAGLDSTIPAYSTQLACSTSMAAAIQASGLVGRGGINMALVGGAEVMSRIPIGLTDDAAAIMLGVARSNPMAIPELIAKLTVDDLTLPRRGWANRITGRSMGDHMEESAKTYAIARSDQDRLAFESHTKAAAARDRGFFQDLITPYGALTRDALIRSDTTIEKLAALQPAFDPDNGSLTAGNSSPLTDGAASIWVVNATGRRRLAPETPAVRLVDFEFGAVDFNNTGMLMAPGIAIPRLLQRHKLRFDDIALWEIHEAFAAQVLANLKLASQFDAGLGVFPWDRLNPNGGSLALGHPFAATGARILSQAVKELAACNIGAKAIVSICADGGQATVALLERA